MNNAVRKKQVNINNKHRKKAKIISIPKKREKFSHSLFKFILSTPFLMTTVVVLTVINLNIRVQINETHSQVKKAEKILTDLQSNQVVLNSKIENILSHVNLEESAKKLGMQKRVESQVHYINTPNVDYAEIIKEK